VARRAGGPAYGVVVLYGAGKIGLEQLVRAVLLDQSLDPERREEYRCVVCRAFDRWMAMGYARMAPRAREACADCAEKVP
jgi:hypothetical protein